MARYEIPDPDLLFVNWKGDYLYICLNQAPWEVNFFPSTFWVSSAQFSMTDG